MHLKQGYFVAEAQNRKGTEASLVFWPKDVLGTKMCAKCGRIGQHVKECDKLRLVALGFAQCNSSWGRF